MLCIAGVCLNVSITYAFDTIDHGILQTKLNHYGIRGVAKNWLASYPHNIQQYVNINVQDSRMANVECGVPQGSIIRPQLLYYISMAFLY